MRRPSSAKLVGRAGELAALDAAVERTARHEPSITLVLGEAGVGKTRLVREFARQAGEGGVLVLEGDCLELSGGEFPYAPIGAALRCAPPDLHGTVLGELTAPVRGELAHVFPDVAGDFAGEREPAAERFAQARLFGSLLALLRGLTERRRVLLVIEDTQWADASSRDFLRFLAHNLRAERLAVVMTVREEVHPEHPVRAFIADLCRDERTDRIELRPLSRDEVERQLSGILAAPPRPQLVERIFARSQGNPLYTEELLAAGASESDVLPTTLRDALLLRVKALTAAAQGMLRVLAALGRPAGHELVRRASGLDGRHLTEAMREAVGHHVLIHDARTGRVQFRHALLREAVYGDLLPAERLEVHGAVAHALDSEPEPENASERAHHWDAAGEREAALLARLEAALVAEEVYAHGEALAHFERALALWRGGPPLTREDPLDPVEWMTRAAEAARLTGDYDRARELCQQALAGFDHAGDPGRAAGLYERLGRYQPWNMKASLAAYRQALRLLPEHRTPERARLLGDEALTLTFMARWTDARQRAKEALDLAREIGARAEEGSARVILGVAQAFLGDPAAGEAELREGLRLASESGNAEDLGRGYLDLGEFLRLQGRVEEALEAMTDGERLVARLGAQDSFGSFMAVNAAEDLLRLGRWDEARRRLQELERRQLGPTGTLLFETVAGRLDAAQGLLETAGRHFERARELCREGGPTEFLPALYAGWAELELWRGVRAEVEWRDAVDAARQRVETGLAAVGEEADPLNAPMLYSMGVRVEADAAELARALGHARVAERNRDAGERLADGLTQLLTAPGPTPAPPEAAAHRATCRAELARLRGEPASALWVAVGEAWSGLRQPYPAAYAAWREAEARLAEPGGRARASPGQRAGAARALRVAHAESVRLAAGPLREEIEALARRARLDIGQAEPDRRAGSAAEEARARVGLTDRELEVLRLLADGLTNRQIAERLFISQKTAGVHVSHILAKLDARNRLMATATARRLGLLGTEERAAKG